MHPDVMILCDKKGKIVKCNEKGSHLFECQNFQSVYDFISPKERLDEVLKGNKTNIVQFEAVMKGQSTCQIHSIPLVEKGLVTHHAMIIKEIPTPSFRGWMENDIRAFLDQLCERKTFIAVLLIQVTRYEYMEEMFGEKVRELFFSFFEKKLKEFIPNHELIGKLSNNQFVVILRGRKNHQDVVTAVERMEKQLERRFCFGQHELYYDYQIGISFYPEDGLNAERLLIHSEIALKNGQEKNKKIELFQSVNFEDYKRKKWIENELNKAVEKNELTLYYQPVVDTKGKSISAFEVLLRWKHEKLGMVSPVEFIPIAEETGLIIKIGKWTMNEALKQLKAWDEEGFHHLRLSINISLAQFYQPDFVEMVEQLLQKYRLAPERLELEFTESIPFYNIDRFQEIVARLRKLNVQLSIDDFGTGFSSLSYLTKLKLDKIKIDRSFIQSLNEENDAVINSIISLAKNLQLSVVAEGVEEKDHVHYLKEKDCYVMQGFYFSKPISTEEAERLLKDWESPYQYAKGLL